MVDVTAGQGIKAGGGFPSLGEIGDILKRGDLALAFGVLTILVVLILPLPSIVLDLFLAISITVSILILMTSLFIQAPLEFSSFPTILLISTMLRLSLNMASTRLILSKGHEGTAAAGHVIEAFGNFVMSGNFVIGIIVFAILVIVNFVVITKGSGRIAEVAARFQLDSMPGKQMAIDADLSAGLIDETTAKARRKELEDESGFFGAMDGASKFVRGDAVAGLLIVFINVIGGIIIGVAQQGMSFGDAARTYTVLTVGDGLVTQVPALIVSTAAGLLVSKAGITGAADKALIRQLSGYPQALGMSAGVMLVLALLPGIPMLPFLALGGGAAALAWKAHKHNRNTRAAEAAALAAPDIAAAAAQAAAAMKRALADRGCVEVLSYPFVSPSVHDDFGLAADAQTTSVDIRRRTGFVSDNKELYDAMTVEEMIRFTRPFFPRWRTDLEKRYLHSFELPLDRKVKALSRGMRTKLALLLALSRGAELLILDEPTEGLDPLMQEVFYDLVAEMRRRGRTVFMSSHVLPEVERVCDRIAVLRKGQVVLLSSVEDARKLASRRVRVAFQQDVAVPASLPQGYEMIDAKPRIWILRVTGQLGSLPSFLVALPVADLAVEEARLEDVLVKYYRDGAE
jgi:ABC-type multidrug transport system ATPase subunit